MASASAVAMSNLLKGKGVAAAAERRIASAAQAGGSYTNLLSPLKIRNKVAKNRILYTVSTPYFLMGPETYPPDVIRTYYADIAKSAGIVMVRMSTDMGSGNSPMSGYAAQMPGWNGDDARVHNYIDQMIEGVHAEGGLVGGANIGGGMGGGPGRGSESMTIEEVVTEAKEAEDKGYDVAYVGGRNAASVEDLEPILEKMEAVRNATGLIVVCWVLPTIEGLTQGGGGPGGGAPAGGGSGQMPGGAAGGQMPGGAAGGDQMPEGAAGGQGGGQGAPGGGSGGGQSGPMMGGGSSPSIDDVVAMAKRLDGVADIFQMRDAGSYTSHPNSFNQERGKPNMLLCAEAVKKSGAKILTAPNAGFNDPDLNEEFIASGKTDMVAMARALIADPYYALKLGEGRGEDVTPCVMCNECHGTSKTDGPWLTFCAVNPKLGLPSSVNAIRPPVVSKKVAVIGGGPAGMKAALVAAERGHKVTLFEKENALGGLQRHTDYCSLKWSFRDFKNYLINQVEKAGIEVRLGTTATPEMIKKEGFDTVLAALGSEPSTSRIPGADGNNVFDIMEAYSKEKSMGKNVVLIGGGDYGTEAGISLANAGHNVTAITTAEELMTSGPHDRVGQIYMYQNMENFTAIVKALPSKISGGKVYYTDADGKEQSVKADSVVVYGGLKPLQKEAMKFHGAAKQVLLLGDCTGKNGTIQKTIRSAYFMASQV
jgi:thioredoxin reductase